MKKSKAIEHLRTLMHTLQKFRSNTTEDIQIEGFKELAPSIWPWVYGDKCQLPTLAKIINRYEKTEELEPIAYYNQMFIVFRFMPEIEAACEFTDAKFPTGPPGVILEWDDEDNIGEKK